MIRNTTQRRTTSRLLTTPVAGVVSSLIALGALTGCQQTPPVIKVAAETDQAVVSSGIDYLEIQDAADDLTRRMLASGFLENYRPHPTRMVVSDIENKTDISGFPNEILLSRVRERMLESGKAVYVSSMGDDATDRMTREGVDVRENPRFESSTVPEFGRLQAPTLSLRTQVLWTTSIMQNTRQNTYQVRMFVTDKEKGKAVWEGTSRPIGKVSRRAQVGW